jgi:membrane fusion protein (multidrug efflux system)
MFLRLILVVLFLAAVFGGIFGWKHYQAQQAAAGAGAPPPAVVAATAVKRESWQPRLRAVGSLSAVAGIDVTAEVSGKVRAIRFRSGDSVTTGDLLLELDDDTDQAALRGLQAEASLARLKFDRVARLINEKTVSKSDFDEARATLDNAQAQVAAQQALIAKKRIRAPFDGRLGIRRVDPGQYLAPGTPIVPLEQLNPIHADFSLPERELARVAVGQAIEVRVQAYPDEVFAGEIIALDPGVEEGSRSLRLQARLGNPDERLRPGMFADVQVLLPQMDEVLTIPDTAISYAPYGDSVFVLETGDAGMTVVRRQVETGDTRDGRVEILSGLEAGDRVVSAGHNKLRNGLPVTVDDQPAPAERSAGMGAG